MTTSQEFDAAYEQLAKGLRDNLKAHQTFSNTMAQAQQKRDDGLRGAKAAYDRTSSQASSRLNDVKNTLREARDILRNAHIREHEAGTAEGNRQGIQPQAGLEQSWKELKNALQSIQGFYRELERIWEEERRQKEARQKMLAIIFVAIVLSVIGIFVFINNSAEQQRKADMTSTAIAVANLTAVQITVESEMRATLQQSDYLTATGDAAIQATQQSIIDVTSTAFAVQNPPPTSAPPISSNLPTRTAIPAETFIIAPGESKRVELGTGEEHTWTLSISTESRVSIQAVADTFGRPDAYLEVFDSNNRLLGNDDDGGGNLNPRIASLPVRRNTQYTIVVSSRNQSSGTYVISVDVINQ